MQFDLIKEVLTGSITGYITNAIAIKMIFREYGIGKAKLGGVVLKTKGEFIDNVSSLVERDIITYETLNSELDKEAFKNNAQKFTNDLLEIHIPKNVSGLYLKEVEGYASTVSKAKEYVNVHANEHLPSFFNTLCKNIYLKDLLKEEQLYHISGEVFKYALDTLNSKDFIEKTIVNFYNEHKDLSFGEFLENELIDALSKNLEGSLKDLHIDLKDKFDNHIDNVLENTIKALEVDKVLNKLEENLLEKRIRDFISIEDNDNLLKSLKEKIKEFLKSEEGSNLINELSKDLFSMLKSIDKPVSDLLSDSFNHNIENFFKEKLQDAVKEIILWIEKNKGDIEGLIEKAIDDTIHSIDDSTKKNVINLVRDKFSNGIAQKFDIVSKITEHLDKNTDINLISRDISLMIIKQLKAGKISDIIVMLEKNEILTQESFFNLITNNVESYIDCLSDEYIDGILNKKVKEVCNFNLNNVFQTSIKGLIIAEVKENFIYAENTSKLVKERIVKALKDIRTLSIGELITGEELQIGTEKVKKLIIEKINGSENNIKNTIFKELDGSIDSISLYESLNDDLRKDLLSRITSGILDKTEVLFKEYGDKEVKSIFDKIRNIENVNSNLSDSLVSLLKNNLQFILKGNIKKAVSTNLTNLKDEELQVMVEEFMGKEMKPITVIGALLGAIVGIGMYFFDKSAAQYNYVTGTLISIVVYALVGWMTNVQALAMLFKPYKEKRILGIKIPFTPGVIVSRKPKFAKSMSTFVDEELLKKSSIEELFSKNKESIYNKLQETLSKDDYKMLGDLLYRYSDVLSNKSYDYLKSLICENKGNISEELVNEIGGNKLGKVSLSGIKDKTENELLRKMKNLDLIINNGLSKFISSETKLEELTPKGLELLIKKQLAKKIEEEIENFINYISKEDKRNKLLSTYSSRYEQMTNKTANEVISTEQITKWKKSFSDFTMNKVTSKKWEDKILKFLEDITSKELNSNKRIDQVFGGFFAKILEDNFSYVTETTVKSIVKGLSNNQGVIAEVAITTTKENLGFFELMGYNMLGGDEIISTIVDNLINDKFPAFIEEKKGELQDVLGRFIGNKIYSSEINDLNIKLKSAEVLEVINSFTKDSQNLSLINNSIAKAGDVILDWVAEAKLLEYMKLLGIDKIEDFATIFSNELELLGRELGNSTALNKEELINQYTIFAYGVFQELILSQKTNELMNGIEEEHISSVAVKLNTVLTDSKSIKEGLNEFLQDFFNGLESKNVSQLISTSEFNNSIIMVLDKIIENEEISIKAKSIIADVIKDSSLSNLTIIDSSVKKFMTNIIITSVMESAEENFSNVLGSVDFRKVTEKQINEMEPKEIEDLFNSFAEKYFSRLKLYGLGGAVFGIHWMVGVATSILYALSSLKEKIKN